MHAPVMVGEVLEQLQPSRGGLFVDGTVGLGGHARAILEAGASRLIGIDRDRAALALASAALAGFDDRVELVHGDYRDLAQVIAARGISSVDGVLVDLGVSSMQLDEAGRGFSFRRDEPLDMRMDRSSGVTAAEAIATADERTLADVIYQFGEERYSRRIARNIVAARATAPIETTAQLADVVRRSVPRRGYERIDPATRTFQALRIWVNAELDGLDEFIATAVELLRPGGRMAAIAFHSLEDRIVKHAVRRLRDAGVVTAVTRRPVQPGDEEMAANPRARSAKLRVVERVA